MHPTRAIFTHAGPGPSAFGGGGWRDKIGFNALYLRAAFPALTVEVDEDWRDRVRMTSGTRVSCQYERQTLTIAQTARAHGTSPRSSLRTVPQRSKCLRSTAYVPFPHPSPPSR